MSWAQMSWALAVFSALAGPAMADLAENFDTGTALPAGWINGGSTSWNNASHYSSAPYCRAFAAGQSLQTPLVDYPTNLSFYVDVSNKGNGQSATVDYSVGGGGWIPLGSFVATTVGSTKNFPLASSPNLSATAGVRFRFNSTFSTWYLDDVVLRTASETPSNAPPFLSLNPAETNRVVLIGEEIRIVLVATEVDGDEVALSAVNLPDGAVFEPNPIIGLSPLSHSFTWTPAVTGVFAIVFRAEDKDGAAEKTIRLSVSKPDQTILLAENFDAATTLPAGWSTGGTMNEILHFLSMPNCRALDTGDTLTTPAVDFPTNLAFYVDASANGNNQTALVEVRVGAGAWQRLGTFVVREVGTHETFSLLGLPGISDSEGVQFQFSSTFNTWYLDDVLIRGRMVANQPPTLAPIGPQAVALGQTLTVEVAASDYDGDVISLTASNLPPGAAFAGATNAGTATCTFSYEPQESETGMVYATTFYASDINGVSSETVAISVHERLVGFASTATEVWEQDGTQRLAVVLSSPGDVALNIVASGTATPGVDYVVMTPHLTFTAEGSATQYVELAILEDTRIEAAETVVLTLTNVTGAGVAAAARQVVTIRDNEAALYEPLNSNPGWSMQGQWAFGRPLGGGGGSGHKDPTSGFTGANVYGVNLAGDYPNNLTNAHYLTTTAIDCSRFRNVKLAFQRWLGVETSWYDQAGVQASNDGVTWVDVWRHDGYSLSDGAWTNVVFDLSALADGQPTVFIRWGLGPTDIAVHYCGWNIDDVVVTGDPVTKALFRFSGSLYTAYETAPEALVTIERIGLTHTAAEVVLIANSGTATAGADYEAVEQTLVFAPGERSRTFAIALQDDADIEGEETIDLRLVATETGEIIAPSEATLVLFDDESSGAAIPFFDGFESGALADCWAATSTGAGRIQIGYGVSTPYEGANQLSMDVTNYYDWGLNEAVLTVDLFGQTNLVLNFQETNWEYGHQAMPATFTGSVKADGVAVSADGIHWLRLFDPPVNSWGDYGATNRTINLTTFAAAHGLALAGHFKIKFQQYDADGNYYGRSFDNIQIYDPMQVADVRLTVAASENPVEVGTELGYTLRVTNAGPQAVAGLVVSNRLAAGAEFISVASSQGSCSQTGQVVLCELGGLPTGGSATINLAVRAPSTAGILFHRAWAYGDHFDPVTTNNHVDAVTVVDERGGTINLALSAIEVTERAGVATLGVIRSGATYGEVSVEYATVDGTAVAGADYAMATGRLVLASGQTSAFISVAIHDDNEDEPFEAFHLVLSNPGGGAVLGSHTTTDIRIHDDDGRAAFPFLETFESGRLTNCWRTYSTATGRIQITTNNGPVAGETHLTMDTSDFSGYALNELVLTSDLAGQSGVTLSFWHRMFNDSPHSMSNAFVGHHNADGVAVSVDGVNWVKVQGLTQAEGGSNEYRRFEVPLDPILDAKGWAYTSTFQVKFQQYDYYPIPYRGFAFDEIALFSRPGELRWTQAAYEASETSGVVLVTVERVNGNLGEVTVPFAVTDGTAVAPDDYIATNGVLTFADGEITASFAIELVDDEDDESAETILLTLGEPTGGATLVHPHEAVLTLHDDDGAGTFVFEAEVFMAPESNALAQIYVWRLEGAEGEASVDYATADGTAAAGLDYAEATGTVFFAAGITSRYFTVTLQDDAELEDTETVYLQLSNPSPGAVLGSPAAAVLNILDDEDPQYDYYLPAYGKEGPELKQALHDVIKDHRTFSYTPSLWSILQEVDECPTNAAQVQLIYMQMGRDKFNNGGNAGQWNREHLWPQSHGAGNPFGSGDPSPTWPSSVDAHHLRPSDVQVNSMRGNKDFDEGGTPVAGAPATCRTTASTFEPPDASKGDIARTLFYMDVRYAGDVDNEPDLQLVDAINTSGTQLGRLSTLIRWHFQDPPDDFERRRNDLIHAHWQGNRNPFIDHPEWVLKVWEYNLGIATVAGVHGSIAPANPQVPYHSDQFFEIQPDPYFHIADVRTNGVSLGAAYGASTFSFIWGPVVSTGMLEVVFAENRAAHGTPEWWLATHGITNGFDAAEGADPDEDGIPTWQEYVMDTHPGIFASHLRVDSMEFARDGEDAVVGYILTWPASTGRVYDVEYLDDLVDDIWLPLGGLTNLRATSDHLSITNVFHDGRLRMLRLQVRQP